MKNHSGENNIVSRCHCGNIELIVDFLPETVTRCNCSACSRYGAIWAYFTLAEVSMAVRDIAPVAYQWGDKMIDFMHCPVCGCTTHYVGVDRHLKKETESRLAVNFRLCPHEIWKNLPTRYFDGADSFQEISAQQAAGKFLD